MRQHFLLLIAVAACGTLPTASDDGGLDSSVVDDVVGQDVVTDASSQPDVDSGSPTEAGGEAAAVDGGCFNPLDASTTTLDLDAATAPWGTDFGNGTFFSADVDRNGNILLGGYGRTNADEEFSLVEVSPTGNKLWSKVAGSGASYPTHEAWDVAFDAAGNMYAAGETSDAIDLGGGNIGPGAFIVKYDPSGNFAWAYGPFAHTIFYRLRAKSNGNIVAAGELGGSDDFGGGSISPSGGDDALVVEVTSCMSYVQSKIWGDSGTQEIDALAVDANDDIILGGRFDGSLDFGGGAMTGPTANSGSFNLFVAKLDANEGYLHQINTSTTSNNSMINAVAADKSGNVFVAGNDADSVNLGGGALLANGNEDAFIGELDGNLSHKWSKHFGNASAVAVAWSVAPDPTGGVAIGGQYNDGNLNFGQGALPTGAGTFLAQLDSNGNATRSWGASAGSASSQGTAFVTWPDFVIAGLCSGGALSLPSGNISCGNANDAFAARLKP